MLKKLLGTILCILVMVLGVICYMEFKSPASGERIDDYLLSAGNGTYCGGTKTGSVELNIEIKGSGFQKMFPTSDDITKNGNHLIVDTVISCGSSVESISWQAPLTNRTVCMTGRA